MITDINEIPTNYPSYWYEKEIERSKRSLENHKNWLEYHKTKIKKLNEIKNNLH